MGTPVFLCVIKMQGPIKTKVCAIQSLFLIYTVSRNTAIAAFSVHICNCNPDGSKYS